MKLITVEEHICDVDIEKARQRHNQGAGSRFNKGLRPDLPYDPPIEKLVELGSDRLADMDKNGIDMQVITISGAQDLPDKEAIPLTQNANHKLADAIKKNPERFAGFATLPFQNPDAAALELERAVTKLGLKGTTLTGRPGENLFLDDPKFAPVLQVANDLEVPVYIHPGLPMEVVQKAYYDNLPPLISGRLLSFGWGWHNETGIQILRMILSGVFERHPNLKIIAGHWGEMIPFFLARLDEAIPKEATGLPLSISEYFKKHVYVTPSGMFAEAPFKFIMNVIGAERIIYSVDYPFIGNEGAKEFLENFPMSRSDREKISHLNAEKLLKL